MQWSHSRRRESKLEKLRPWKRSWVLEMRKKNKKINRLEFRVGNRSQKKVKHVKKAFILHRFYATPSNRVHCIKIFLSWNRNRLSQKAYVYCAIKVNTACLHLHRDRGLAMALHMRGAVSQYQSPLDNQIRYCLKKLLESPHWQVFPIELTWTACLLLNTETLGNYKELMKDAL